ncbi:MAG: hypothetical protein WBW99_11420, partial [Pseudolabrys sp.]
LELCVNSETRADRGRRMLESLVDGLVGVPLVERQTLKGRDKLVVWLKLLENQTAKHAPEHPMSSYDLTWMWRELGLYDRRN